MFISSLNSFSAKLEKYAISHLLLSLYEIVSVEIFQTPSLVSKREIVHCYAVSRFVSEVSGDFICSICREVPKDPRVCQNRDHLFCLDHITRHLHENSHRCPVCRDPLTPETLKPPGRHLKNSLGKLKIKCDHHDRRCPDVLPLEDLQRHVDQCEFSPVKCENEGCEMTINKRDKEIHVKHLCRFRFPRCHDCQDIKDIEKEILVIHIRNSILPVVYAHLLAKYFFQIKKT